MSVQVLTSTRGSRAALGAFALGAVLALWTLVRAIRLTPVPDAKPLEFATADAIAPAPPATPLNVRAAVDHDLFASDRSAPDHRYRLPGESDPAAEVAKAAAPQPVVLGIGLSDDAHSFATCSLEGGQPVIVHVGDKIGIYTVKTIERGHVIFVSADGKKLDIPALKPGS